MNAVAKMEKKTEKKEKLKTAIAWKVKPDGVQ